MINLRLNRNPLSEGNAPPSDRYSVLRTIKYSGNKIRLLPVIVWIANQAIGEGAGVLDLMAGTHSVGYALKDRFRICANDIQRYSFVIGKALIENGGYSTSRETAQRELLPAIQRNQKNARFDLFRRLYADTYFSRYQCMEIDDIRAAIEEVPSPRRELYLTALMSVMCHASNTTGHFAEFFHNPKPNSRSIQELFFRKCENLLVSPNRYPNKVFNLDYRCFFDNREPELSGIARNAGLMYLDPPYSSAQYSRFYHILETVVKYDYPSVEFEGRYRKDRYLSDFCRKSRAKTELEFLLDRCSSLASGFVLLSYVNSSSCLISVGDVVNAVVERFNYSTGPMMCRLSHSRMGNGAKKEVTEYLILAANSDKAERVIKRMKASGPLAGIEPLPAK